MPDVVRFRRGQDVPPWVFRVIPVPGKEHLVRRRPVVFIRDCEVMRSAEGVTLWPVEPIARADENAACLVFVAAPKGSTLQGGPTSVYLTVRE